MGIACSIFGEAQSSAIYDIGQENVLDIESSLDKVLQDLNIMKGLTISGTALSQIYSSKILQLRFE